MDKNMKMKVDRLNELYSRAEMGTPLTNAELTEQAMLRDEMINYFKNVINVSKLNG